MFWLARGNSRSIQSLEVPTLRIFEFSTRIISLDWMHPSLHFPNVGRHIASSIFSWNGFVKMAVITPLSKAHWLLSGSEAGQGCHPDERTYSSRRNWRPC